jgi:malonyl-CoA/methylmalonyl-CoA synthetase
VVVCSPGNFGWVGKIAFQAGTRNVFTLGDDRTGTLLERAARHSDQHEPVKRGADDLAAILYTSGTTGRSKGAMLTHGNLLSNAQVLKDYWGWKPGDVLIHALPIFHVHGLFVALHGALLNGSKMLWHAKFDPKRAIAAMREATIFMGVPTLYTRMLAEPALTKDAVRNMRLFVSGSAPLLLETFNDWQERTGHTILERYGMSETVMLASNPYDAKLGERRGGTVGFPAAGRGIARARRRWPGCSHRRDRRYPGEGPGRLQGLLAHAREDQGRIHRGRLLQDRRRRQDSTSAATSPSSGAART